MSSLPFPYTQPTSSQSQVRQKAKLFISATRCAINGSLALFRNNKGNWTIANTGTGNIAIAADLAQNLREYASALIKYSSNPNNVAISINSLTAIYSIATAPLTTLTLGLSQGVINPANNLLTVTDVIAPTAIPTAIAANMISPTVTPANPGALLINNATMIAEFVAAVPANTALNFNGFLLDFNISR